MTRLTLLAIAVSLLALSASAGVEVPAVAVHIEKHSRWSCDNLPAVTERTLKTTYDGVGEIDAFVVFFNFGEARGTSFAMTWPATWGRGTWHDCSQLKISDIAMPGDMTSIILKGCAGDSMPLIAGWLTLTVTTPGKIEVLPSENEGAVAIADCNEAATEMVEAIINLKAGAGGAKGDDVSELTDLENRNWYLRADSTGDALTITDALRQALPGDTVFVAQGHYDGHLVLRQGVVLTGSWDDDFQRQAVEETPSIIDGHGHHSVIRCGFREDSTTVLDGFVITGGEGSFGAGIACRNGSSPVLRNLIIHSNSAKYGGAIACHAASPIIRNVLIAGNKAETGAGIYCVTGSSPLLSNLTFVANEAPYGAAIFSKDGSSPFIEKSIIAYNGEANAVFVSDPLSGITLACCDLWENGESDYGGHKGDTFKLKDNMAQDPQFVDPDNVDFRLKPDSPLRSIEGCGRVGAAVGRMSAE
jgi:predicted outer membrane repeat protein